MSRGEMTSSKQDGAGVRPARRRSALGGAARGRAHRPTVLRSEAHSPATAGMPSSTLSRKAAALATR